MTRARQNIVRPDLQVPVEERGTIKGATSKLTWLARVDAVVAAGTIDRSFAHLAINIATNPKGVNSETGLTWRSARTLADVVGLSKSAVDRLLNEAVAAGLLFVVRKGRPGRDGQSTMFRLAMPEAGNGLPVRRFQRKKRPAHEAKNPESASPREAGNASSMVPETPHPGQKKRPASGTHLLRDSISVENKHRVAAEGGADTARGYTAAGVRESGDESTADYAPLNPAITTVDDAAIPEPQTPVPRAEARTELHAAKQPSPERNETEIGRPGANGHAAPDASPFAQVLSIYPADRVGDEAKAYFAFARALDARGSLSAVLEALASLMLDYGADGLPDLADALAIIIERGQARRTGRQ